MTRADNEQELVLGNKQLLSAFFVVVALLGIFFAMGYVVGKNTNSSDAASKKVTPIDRSAEAGGAAETAPAVSAVPDPLPSQLEPAHNAPEARPVETPKPVKAEKAAGKPVEDKLAEAPSRVVSAETTAGHTYLQVMAVKRPVADSTVKMLKSHSLPALLGESSKPDLYRVLVGPYTDNESLAKAKTELKKMGFDTFISK